MRILQLFKNGDPKYKGHLCFFLVSYFFALFNYPLVRASSITMFFDEFGAKSSPVAWVWTVLVLALTVALFNKLQARYSVQKVFLTASLLSTLLFALSAYGFAAQIRYSTYISFIWKEICIVLQVHLLLGYANNFFRKEDFKFVIGPLGAVGSLGGIFGGMLTTYIGREWGTSNVAWISLIFVLAPGIFFMFTPYLSRGEAKVTHESPVASLNTPEVRKYVFYVAAIVMLSQFIINIADFKFNLSFEKTILLSDQRTAYLGSVYAWTNVISMVFQFVCLPFLLPRIAEKSLHLFIPISYLFCLLGLFLFGEYLLLTVAFFYVYLKASDYSLFSAGKELLYQPLSGSQKYGAKYLTDMLVYRFSKALIAAVLIYVQSSSILNMMMALFILIWFVLVIRIFGIHRSLF